MTKVINKKALLVLLTLVLAFCWLSVPVSAAEVENESYIGGDVAEPQWGGQVYNLTFESLDVYALKYDEYGRPYGAEIDLFHPSWSGSSKGFFCYLTEDFYQGMIDQNLNEFYCEMWFDIDGTELTKFEILLNDEVIYTKTGEVLGTRRIIWSCPRMPEMEIGIKVYSQTGVRSTIWARVIPR